MTEQEKQDLMMALDTCAHFKPCTVCSYENKCSMSGNQAMLDAIDLINTGGNCTANAVVGGLTTTHWYQCDSCRAPINVGDKFCHECGKVLHWKV